MDEDQVSEDEGLNSQKESRQHSAVSKGSRVLHTSGKSRPVSSGSSLNTDVPDTELENVMKSKRHSGEDTTEISDTQ